MIKLQEKGVEKLLRVLHSDKHFVVEKERGQVGKITLFINLQNKFSMLQWKCLLIAMQ